MTRDDCRDGGETNRRILLYGTILESKGSHTLLIDVVPHLGDAAEFGLAGQITFLERQIHSYTQVGSGRDLVIVPEHVAVSKSPSGFKRRRK